MTTETLSTSETFEKIYTRYFAWTRSYLLSHGARDYATAEDLAQDTLVRLWRDLSSGRISELTDIEHLSGFMATRARWTLLSYIAAQQARHEQLTAFEGFDEPSKDGQGNPLDVVAARITAGQLIAALDAPTRRVLALHLLEDLSLAQVAEETGMSLRAVKAQLRDGLTALRTRLGVTVTQEDIEARAAARRESARQVYLASVEAGRPLTMRALAEQFGASYAWAINAVRVEGGIKRHAPMRDVARDTLRAELQQGLYPPGSRMPSCTKLAERWDTNFGTVAWALRVLTEEGYVRRGKARRDGYFVADALPVAEAA